MNNVSAAAVESNSGMSFATLIPVREAEIGGEFVQVCSARDLHICLNVRRHFATWINERVADYGFVDGVDFLVTQNRATKRGRGGDRRSKHYDITMDMAKELAMVERTEQGRAIRRYFIECEKKLRQIDRDAADDIWRRTLSPKQQHELTGKVAGKVAILPKGRQRSGYAELWGHLKQKFQVARYCDINQGEFGDACQFVDGYVWEGEWLAAEKRVEGFDDYLNLGALITCMQNSHEIFAKHGLYRHLTGLGSRAGIEIINFLEDGRGIAGMLKRRYAEPIDSAHREAMGICNRALAAS